MKSGLSSALRHSILPVLIEKYGGYTTLSGLMIPKRGSYTFFALSPFKRQMQTKIKLPSFFLLRALQAFRDEPSRDKLQTPQAQSVFLFHLLTTVHIPCPAFRTPSRLLLDSHRTDVLDSGLQFPIDKKDRAYILEKARMLQGGWEYA